MISHGHIISRSPHEQFLQITNLIFEYEFNKGDFGSFYMAWGGVLFRMSL